MIHCEQKNIGVAASNVTLCIAQKDVQLASSGKVLVEQILR